MQHGELRSDRGSWFVNEFSLQFSLFNIHDTFKAGNHPTFSSKADMCGTDSDPASVSSSHVERTERGDPLTKPTKNPKPNKDENHDLELGDPCQSEIPEWLQEFTENLVDDRVPEHKDSHARSSHGSTLEPERSAVFILTSRKTEIARSVKGPKLQGPHA